MDTLYPHRACNQRHSVVCIALLLLLLPASVQAQALAVRQQTKNTRTAAAQLNVAADANDVQGNLESPPSGATPPKVASEPNQADDTPPEATAPVQRDEAAAPENAPVQPDEAAAPATAPPDTANASPSDTAQLPSTESVEPQTSDTSADAAGVSVAPLPTKTPVTEAAIEQPQQFSVPSNLLGLSQLPLPPRDKGPSVAVRDVGAAHQSNASTDHQPRVLGTLVDIGVPDGVMLGLAVRPWSVIRLDAAVGTNAVSLGVRAGVTARLPSRISPVLSIAAGHYFEGNANGVARGIAGSNYNDSPLAESIGYQFANLHTGVEFGILRSTLYLHGGMSYLRSKLHDTTEALRLGQPSNDTGVVVDVKRDPSLSAWVPSIKVGFLMYWV